MSDPIVFAERVVVDPQNGPGDHGGNEGGAQQVNDARFSLRRTEQDPGGEPREDEHKISSREKTGEERQSDSDAEPGGTGARMETVGQDRRGRRDASQAERKMVQPEIIGRAGRIEPGPAEREWQQGGSERERSRARRAGDREKQHRLPRDQREHVQGERGAAGGSDDGERDNGEKIVQRALRRRIGERVQQAGHEAARACEFVSRVALGQILNLIIPPRVNRRVAPSSELIEEKKFEPEDRD
jgi:hypothetical protein